MMKLKLETIFLAILSFLYLFIRIYKLVEIPYGFHSDEASIGYNAYSILKTGKDEWGARFPLFNKAFFDYPAAAVLYVEIPFIFLFGLNEFTVRLPVVCLSFLNFLLFYLILKKLGLQKQLIFLNLFLLVICPWEIINSRATSETVIGAFFFLLGFNFLINFFKTKNIHQYLFFIFAWTMTIVSYNSYRILMPLTVLLTFPLLITRKTKRKIIIYSLLITLFCCPFLVPFIFKGTGINAQHNLTFFSPVISQSLQALAFQSSLMKAPYILTRIFHNKISYLLFSLIKNSFEVISFHFLFLVRAVPNRYAVPENGLLLYIAAPFLIIGLIYFMTSKIKNTYKVLFLGLTLFSFLPTIITSAGDFPNNRRSFFALYPLVFLTAYGINYFLSKVKIKKILLVLITFGFSLNFFYFWFFYQYHSAFLASHSRNYFYKQINQVVYEKYDQYKNFKIYSYSENPYIFFLFFNKYDPKKYQKLPKDMLTANLFDQKEDWGFDKYIFTQADCPIPEPNQLVLTEYEKCITSNRFKTGEPIDIKGVVHSPYGSKEFVYYELKE